MAAFFRGLCLILLLWTSGSRTASVVQTESPDSISWWDRDPLNIGKRALAFRTAGDNHAAEAVYREGYEAALALGEKSAAARYLMSAGACLLLDFHYRPALTIFLNARELAESAGDTDDAGAIAFNLSSVYLQVWDLQAATRAAEDGLAFLSSSKLPYFQSQLLLQLGRLHALRADGKADSYFAAGIEAARLQNRAAYAGRAEKLEAQGWDLLGEQHLAAQRLAEAERCFGEALRLRLFAHLPGELGWSYSRLGALKLAQGDLRAALDFTERALAASRSAAPSWPEHRLLDQRGHILLAMGQTAAALADFSAALNSAAQWRMAVVPARSSLTSANVGLEQQIFQSFIQVAADYALATGDSAWAARAFGAAETNRAASLRESLALADVWHKKLPAQYWEILGQLGASVGAAAKKRNLRLKLTEMEAEAGVGFKAKKDENFATRASLIHFQEGLREPELFLSFFLGNKESYLWAVSRESLRLYKLGSGPEITERVQAFREALPAGGVGAIRRGQQLYHELFGQLAAGELGKTTWLLSLDGALLQVPFAALVTEQQGGKAVYLVERHSLQTVPGALLLTQAPLTQAWSTQASSSQVSLTKASLGQASFRNAMVGQAMIGGSAGPVALGEFADGESAHFAEKPRNGGWFLGVGDPVYNRADPRWRGQGPKVERGWPARLRSAVSMTRGWFAQASSILRSEQSNTSGRATGLASGELERLVGSGIEVETSASVWRATTGPARVLRGTDARRESFLELLKRRPSVIHLATHVLVGPGENGESYVAFSLTDSRGAANGAPRSGAVSSLSTLEIAALQVPGALVVMTGCSSGTGEVQDGAGLLGLTRAWLMAGAGAVVATAWPVEDNSGEVFAKFYRHLQGNSAAEALRLTQIELVHRGTWESEPANWASYQVSGGAR